MGPSATPALHKMDMWNNRYQESLAVIANPALEYTVTDKDINGHANTAKRQEALITNIINRMGALMA